MSCLQGLSKHRSLFCQSCGKKKCPLKSMLYLKLCTCKVVMRETTGGRAGTQPAVCSSSLYSLHQRKKKARLCTWPKTSRKLFCCIFKVEVCGTISPQLLWFTQMQRHFHLSLTRRVLFLWQRGELHSKMHPAVRTYLFLLTYFHPKSSALI